MGLYRINQVLNYGGFFGGDTLSAIFEPFGGGEEVDFTIDQHAIENVADRYKILDHFVLEIDHDGPTVRRARVVAAPTRQQLKEAIDATTPSEVAHKYRVFAYKCTKCPYGELWVRGEPQELGDGQYKCVLCQQTFNS